MEYRVIDESLSEVGAGKLIEDQINVLAKDGFGLLSTYTYNNDGMPWVFIVMVKSDLEFEEDGSHAAIRRREVS